jgi:hypothetical protein
VPVSVWSAASDDKGVVSLAVADYTSPDGPPVVIGAELAAGTALASPDVAPGLPVRSIIGALCQQEKDGTEA